MDLQTIRDRVRAYLDVEEDELPDSLLDLFVEDGSSRILSKDRRWPWLAQTWSLTTQAGRGDYSSEFDPSIADVASVYGADGRPLILLGHEEAELRFNTLGLNSNGQPTAYSLWGGSLFLWPIPSATEVLSIRGYRQPRAWVTGLPGDDPDMPDEFHQLLVRWAVACGYEQQDDTEMAAYNRDHFDGQLASLHASLMRQQGAQPIVMGSKPSVSPWVTGPLPFPYGWG